jgi:predicted molibdopterin-dependent oxidoreductase YjgC
MINLKIDDTILDVKENTTILNAAASVGIHIPTLCYHKDLSPFGGCRICVVEVKDARLPMTACNTPVAPQMRVRTNTPTVIRYRRAILRMLLSNYYDAGYKRVNGKCGIDEDNDLIRLAREYDVDVLAAMAKAPRFPVDADPNPYLCGRNPIAATRRASSPVMIPLCLLLDANRAVPVSLTAQRARSITRCLSPRVARIV